MHQVFYNIHFWLVELSVFFPFILLFRTMKKIVILNFNAFLMGLLEYTDEIMNVESSYKGL